MLPLHTIGYRIGGSCPQFWLQQFRYQYPQKTAAAWRQLHQEVASLCDDGKSARNVESL
jgi:hypothetical protein